MQKKTEKDIKSVNDVLNVVPINTLVKSVNCARRHRVSCYVNQKPNSRKDIKIIENSIFKHDTARSSDLSNISVCKQYEQHKVKKLFIKPFTAVIPKKNCKNQNHLKIDDWLDESNEFILKGTCDAKNDIKSTLCINDDRETFKFNKLNEIDSSKGVIDVNDSKNAKNINKTLNSNFDFKTVNPDEYKLNVPKIKISPRKKKSDYKSTFIYLSKSIKKSFNNYDEINQNKVNLSTKPSITQESSTCIRDQLNENINDFKKKEYLTNKEKLINSRNSTKWIDEFEKSIDEKLYESDSKKSLCKSNINLSIVSNIDNHGGSNREKHLNKEQLDDFVSNENLCLIDNKTYSIQSKCNVNDLNYQINQNSSIDIYKTKLDIANKTISELQKALKYQEELTNKRTSSIVENLKNNIEALNNDHNQIIKNKVKFIDQLIDERNELTKNYENTQKDLEAVTMKCNKKISLLERKHSIEIKRKSDLHNVTLKLQKEKWIKENENRIKERTIKGMQPTLEKLLSNHKNELKLQKTNHTKLLISADERAYEKYLTQSERLKEQLQREKEAACEHERNLANKSYEDYSNRLDNLTRDKIENLKQDFTATIEKLRQENVSILEKNKCLQNKYEKEKTELNLEYENKNLQEIEKLNIKHSNAYELLKDETNQKNFKWKLEYRKELETEFERKEREMIENYKKQRDAEIEMVIDKLEQECEDMRKDTINSSEKRIRRLQEKYEYEIKHLECSEKDLQQKKKLYEVFLRYIIGALFELDNEISTKLY
ncbi:hypothetical protein A3Q56_06451 [Intoshia linei]|uniref:Uncharacterized protein n=1 Tax=Intoshia linei TaxID=1819745 RepID=A0A177AUW8_9BILA|nr:hypothetical protein A3Q56_06451 [Intoshia linei]